MAAGGRTPMHPGIMATPAHYSSHTTPMHPGMTPGREALTKTPAYDPAWAATPAHPGFGGGGELGQSFAWGCLGMHAVGSCLWHSKELVLPASALRCMFCLLAAPPLSLLVL
jgi:hypothetical protein